jgi:hypothetical protein
MKPQKHTSKWLEEYLKENSVDKAHIEEIIELPEEDSVTATVKRTDGSFDRINSDVMVSEINSQLKVLRWIIDRLTEEM